MMTKGTFSSSFRSFEATVCDADLLGCYHPREIVSDGVLSLARKKQLVSYWLSDIHAVRNAPELRTYQFGPTVTVDALRHALVQLDRMVDTGAIPGAEVRSVGA